MKPVRQHLQKSLVLSQCGRACSGSPQAWKAAQAAAAHSSPSARRSVLPGPEQPGPLPVYTPVTETQPLQCLKPNSRSLKRLHISMLNICLGGSETVCFGVVRVQSSAASSTHVSLPFTAYSTPSTSPANRFVSVGPRDPSFVNIPQQTQVGRFRLLCMPAASSSSVSSNVSPRSQLHCRCHFTHMVSVTTVKCHLQFVCLLCFFGLM